MVGWLTSWVMFVAGIGMLAVWLVAVLSDAQPREVLHEFARIGMVAQTLIPGLWFSLVGGLEIALGCWLLSFYGGSWGWLFLLGGLYFVGIGLWTGVILGIKRVAGVLHLPRPSLEPLHGRAHESGDDELKRKGLKQ